MKKTLILIAFVLFAVILFTACDDISSGTIISNDNQNEATTIPNTQNNQESEEGQDSIIIEENFEVDKSIVALGNVNIRLSPTTTEDNIIGVLSNYQRVTYLQRYNQNWYYINHNGTNAFITANPSFTKIVDNSQTNDVIENIIAEGMTQLGVPYEFGSKRLLRLDGTLDPYFTGTTFDCSAFVQYAFYMGAGIVLKGDSRSQSLEGQMIERANLQRGDLIFMTTPARRFNTGVSRIGHVVIYLGNNQILHTHGVGGVKVDSLTGVWHDRYEFARRMI